MTHVVVLSGGMDSTAALALAVARGEEVRAISFDYGQRHVREVDAAVAVANHFDVPYSVISLRGMMHGSALLGAMEVPQGHYADRKSVV